MPTANCLWFNVSDNVIRLNKIRQKTNLLQLYDFLVKQNILQKASNNYVKECSNHCTVIAITLRKKLWRVKFGGSKEGFLAVFKRNSPIPPKFLPIT